MKNSTKLYFAALLISLPQMMFAQRQRVLEEYYQEENNAKKGFPLYFGLMNRISGVSTIGGAVIQYTSVNYWFLFELMIRVHPKIHLYTQLRALVPITYSVGQLSHTLPMISMNNVQLGTLLGLGGTVYSEKIHGRGWEVNVNGGLVVDFGIYNFHYLTGIIFSTQEILRQFFSLGVEINVRGHYHFSERFSLVVGADIGYIASLNGGDPFLIKYSSFTTSYHTLNYGASIGLNF